MHDLKDAEPNIIDKLAHYSSKTMAGQDVAGYFQSLKTRCFERTSEILPLVPTGQDANSVSDQRSPNTTWASFHKNSIDTATKKTLQLVPMNLLP
ncbi:hypothetical protein CEXT_496761 [Caerostris extrusa]|uniref:Uncharacterized protein n=1 Tax=Caerostris extrusa TaxID=172846 RepID=A0AAV4NMI7_CAEEX|nr:hypothetical protein CEXT_496761 [Caerostris extrusa]